jgi:hypothetical protein
MGAAGPAVTWLMGRSADKFMKQTGRFAAASQESLDKILAMSRGTEYGRRCGLDGAAPQKVFETSSLPTPSFFSRQPRARPVRPR